MVPSLHLVIAGRAASGQTTGLLLLATLLASALPGCATFRSYDAEMNQTLSVAASGRIDAAIATLQNNNKKADRDLLYYFEMGELQRLLNRYGESLTAWRAADVQVQAWEDAARADPARVAGVALSYIVNDKLRPYEGRDYEKVMLTTRMAMDDLGQGQWQNARVAIKRTHEREAVIAAVRSREQQEIEEEARKRGASVSFKDLNGYPVQTIDNPEVNALRNSYQSAFSHYLAGFVYEALGEPSLAAAGYRQAIELHPNVPLLEEALAGLDQRVAAPDDGKTDVLFVIETGLAPARVSRQFNLPIPINERWVLVSASVPVLRSQGAGFVPSELRVEGIAPLVPVQITSVDAMARKALQDEMPGIMLRTFIRSMAKATAQYQAQRAASKRRSKGDDTAGAMLDLTAVALALGSAATESADERSWRSLPANISIARARLPRGEHRVQLETPSGLQTVAVDIAGRYAFVSLRVIGGTLFAMLPKAPLLGTRPVFAPAGEAAAKLPSTHAVVGAPRMAQSVVGSQFKPKEWMP
jgi:hypothetical protein